MLIILQDQESIKMLYKMKNKLSIAIKWPAVIDETFKFDDTIIFSEEFAKKLLDFVLGYILAPKKILEQDLLYDKTKQISAHFIHIFSNMNDPYLSSLKLLKDKDY